MPSRILSMLFYFTLTIIVPSAAKAACGAWSVGTLNAYESDDTLKEYRNAKDTFFNAVPVIAIAPVNWSMFKYRTININYGGKIYTVQSWDQCVQGELTECSNLAKKYASPGFLLSVDRRTLHRLFGNTQWTTLMAKVQYQICDRFDPNPIAKQYGLVSLTSP